jgi:hypothetical protein
MTGDDHPLARAGRQRLAHDFEISGLSDNMSGAFDRRTVASGNGDRDILGIEIDGVAEEYDLHRRHQSNQGYSDAVLHQPQRFNSGDGNYASEAPRRPLRDAELRV